MVQDTDRYGRTVSRVYVGDMDVNAELVRQGAAWVYRQYAKDQSLYTLENEAKAAKRGLWALPEAEQMPPWEWRHGGSGGRLPTPFQPRRRGRRCPPLPMQPVSPAAASGTVGK